MIQITQPYAPNIIKIHAYLDKIYDSAWFTNGGPLVQELTARLEDYLGIENLLLVANGTLALQVAYRALKVENAAATSPFTFVATASSMEWQGIQPHFADIDPGSLNLCPDACEKDGGNKLDAIVPVHVYGNPCDVEAFEKLAEHRNQRLIYDASHAFSVRYKGKSVLKYGDASTLSFHATKLFHTVEGGGIVFKDKETLEQAKRMINFGLPDRDSASFSPGLNAKMSEVHAAFGLAMLDEIDEILDKRVEIFEYYTSKLSGLVSFPAWREQSNRNGAYVPILLQSGSQRAVVEQALGAEGILARRYFYPALHEEDVFHYEGQSACPNASDAADRVLCLPIYPNLTFAKIDEVIASICKAIG